MAALQRPVDYSVPVPSVANPLELLSQGLQQRQENQQAQTKQAIDLSKLNQEQQERARGAVSNAILLADTPEKWAQTVPALAQRLGPQFAQEYGDFSTRDAALAEMGTTEQVSGEIGRRTKAEEQANKPPDVTELYDASGQAQKVTWDAEQNRFVPVGGPKAPTKGITTRTLPDGTVETIIGGSGGGMTQTTQNKVGEKQFNAAELGSRLSGVMADFKPEYQTLYGKAVNTKRSWQAWLDPNSLSPGDKQGLTDFAQYRSKAFGNLSQYLNDLSGAAISPAEFGRLSQAMPNPGTGLFDGDDPVTFKSKLETVASEAQRALARYQFYQQTGSIPASLDEIPLNDVKQAGGKWYVKKDGQWYEAGGADQGQ